MCSRLTFPFLLAALASSSAQTVPNNSPFPVPPPVDLPDARWIPCINDPTAWCTDIFFCAGPWATLTTAPMPASATSGFAYGYRSNFTTECIPGKAPVLRMAPGKVYKVTWHNTADMSPMSIDVNSTLGQMMSTTWVAPPQPGVKQWANMNMPLHATNVHMHGVHVSGMGSHDNVQRTLMPGECMTSVYAIPADHMGGTHLYHPMFQGRTAYGAIGGAFGMVIIEDQPVVGTGLTGLPLDQMVTYFLTSPYLERKLVAYSEGATRMGNGDPLGAPLQLTGTQWFRLRIAHVKPQMVYGRTMFKDSLGAPMSWNSPVKCEIYDIAQDGVYFTRTPWKPYTTNGTTSTYSFDVLGSTRLDLAIRCLNAGTFTIEYDGGVVARVTVLPTPVPNPFWKIIACPFTIRGTQQWKPITPAYLAELRPGFPGFPSYITSTVPAVPVDVGFGGFNGRYWDATLPLLDVNFSSSKVYQFDFTSTGRHPVHIHHQHFQVVQPGGCGALREGERYDAISVYGNTNCLVSVQFVDYSGVNIIHSHVLDQQDMGVMTWFNVGPYPAPGSFEASPAFVPETPSAPCCTPRLDVTGAPVCRFVPECGGTMGINTCNQPCSVPVSVCPPSKPVCSSTGTCFRVQSVDSITDVQLDSECSQPVYPFVLMGVGLAVGAASLVSALLIVRRNRPRYDTMLVGDLSEEKSHQPAGSASPFTAHM